MKNAVLIHIVHTILMMIQVNGIVIKSLLESFCQKLLSKFASLKFWSHSVKQVRNQSESMRAVAVAVWLSKEIF